jgi:hypothetical protein
MRIVAVLLLGQLAAAHIRPDAAGAVINDDVSYRKPFLTDCELPGIVFSIARAAGVPAGVERLPGRCEPVLRGAAPRGERERVFLAGVTVADAMNGLVKLDPRYHWVDADGVIVVRPAAAWADQKHFLNVVFDSFGVADEHMGAALARFRDLVYGGRDREQPIGVRSALGSRVFTLDRVGPISASETLDAIVRAHGALSWEVVYCQPLAVPEFATIFLRTNEIQPEMIGFSMPGHVVKKDGKTIDLCRGSVIGPAAPRPPGG